MSDKSIQSPTISTSHLTDSPLQSGQPSSSLGTSISASSSPMSSTSWSPLCRESRHEKMKKELEDALAKILKLEELLKQKDERNFHVDRI